jgi:hypothetical protein
MKRMVVLLFLSSAMLAPAAGQDQKMVLAGRIVDELFSLGSEADIPTKYLFLYWPAMKELSRESNWPRLELIRDIYTVGDLFEVWPSRDLLIGAVYQNMPALLLKEYKDMTSASLSERRLGSPTEQKRSAD